MALSPYSGPRIRIRANVRIPARVASGPGISQVIAGGVLTTGLDLEDLSPAVSIPDPSLYRLFIYNEATDTWQTTTLDNLPTTTTGDTYTGHGDSNYSILSTDRYLELTAALSAPRTWSLPVATTYPAGTRIVVQDAAGGITTTNTLTIAANAADTINGAANFVLNAAYTGVELRCDGTDTWSVRALLDQSVTDAKLRQSAALSVVGRSSNSIGAPADIVAGTDGYVLLRAGTSLVFGRVTNAGLADMAAATIKLRASGAGTGAPTDGTGAQARTILASPAYARGTAVTLTTQTSVDFTSIPAGTFKIEVSVAALSTNGTSLPIIQIGDSGGIETSAYSGSVTNTQNATATVSVNLSTGFALMPGVVAATVIQGKISLILHDALNTWVAEGVFGGVNAAFTATLGGFKTLSAELDRVRLTTVGGTDQFDAGSVNITYFYA